MNPRQHLLLINATWQTDNKVLSRFSTGCVGRIDIYLFYYYSLMVTFT